MKQRLQSKVPKRFATTSATDTSSFYKLLLVKSQVEIMHPKSHTVRMLAIRIGSHLATGLVVGRSGSLHYLIQ